jgi:hypothetical protein
MFVGTILPALKREVSGECVGGSSKKEQKMQGAKEHNMGIDLREERRRAS